MEAQHTRPEAGAAEAAAPAVPSPSGGMSGAVNTPGRAEGRSEFSVRGMSCHNCVRHVTEAIRGTPGVEHVVVSLEAGRAWVRWASPDQRNDSAVVQAVEAAGYQAEPVSQPATVSPQAQSAARRQSGWQLNLWVGLAGTLPLMLGEWVFGWGSEPWFRWLAFALATVVQVVAGARFYRGAWQQLRAGSASMDTLVALGSTTAYAYSAGLMLARASGHLYFMEAAAIITLISIGHWLEARAGAKASEALEGLLHLAPAQARRLKPDGTEEEVPVAALRVGDRVVLKPGDRVPTDGVVEDGESALDESMLTGEAMPVDKAPGDALYAGTLNRNGRLIMRVTAVGEDTALAHIIEAVQRAQTSRARIQRLADRVSNVFVPLVVMIALGTGAAWFFAPETMREIHTWLSRFLWDVNVPQTELAAAVVTAAAVLIVACPCAMGLATPAAIMAGSNAAAARGILVRDAVALEKAGTITAVVFDKTGTITTGRPKAVAREAWPVRGLAGGEAEDAQTQLWSLAGALAARSSHPLSQTVARAAAATNTNSEALTDWQEVRGAGVMARWVDAVGGAHLLRLGSLRWLRELGVNVEAAEAFLERWSEQGATVLGLAVDDQLALGIALQDALKPGAREVIADLQRHGLKVYVVSGDQRKTVESIARQAGVPPEHVRAETRPEEKAAFVEELQQQGQRVAFVGDGINDAPALEQADLGIAVSRASDIAREAADLILLNSEIEAVPESLGLARATLRTIKQNLFWAFFYNVLSVPLAALGFLSPVLCAAAMGLSDLIVIGNALRLRHWRHR